MRTEGASRDEFGEGKNLNKGFERSQKVLRVFFTAAWNKLRS